MAESPGRSSRFNVVPVKRISVHFNEEEPEECSPVVSRAEQGDDFDQVSTYSQVNVFYTICHFRFRNFFLNKVKPGLDAAFLTNILLPY